MKYEKKMLENLKMPKRQEVEQALLKILYKNNGVIKEFGVGEPVVKEIADDFGLNNEQRMAYLETVYRKENRVKKSYLWHRLLFRAADSLAKENLISRPTKTVLLTNKKEWMLTEEGYSRVLEILHIPLVQKEIMPIRSYEVQKIVNKICKQERQENYSPFQTNQSAVVSRETKLRDRAFQQVVREVYNFRCAVCGLKLFSPNNLRCEIEAAHIVPRSVNGKDDVWNGVAFCRLHHWACDVGWFTLEDNFKILVSRQIEDLPLGFGRLDNYDILRELSKGNRKILLPQDLKMYPHPNAVKWHRENIFYD